MLTLSESWLFIVEGAATVGWAICAYFLLLDFPAQASKKKFSERERLLAIKRLATDNVTITEDDALKLSSLNAVVKALSNWKTWIMVLGYMVRIPGTPLYLQNSEY